MASRTVIADGVLAVEGLRDVINGLKAVSKTLPRTVTKANRAVATQIVLPEARRNWATQRIRPSQARSAIAVTATRTAASIKLRYSKHPYAAGVEFGSLAFRQFRPWRGNQFTVTPGSTTGYVVQAAIRDTLKQVETEYADRVLDAVDDAIPR